MLLLSLPGVSSPSYFTPAVYNAYLNSTFGAAAPLVAAQYPVSAFNNTAYPAFYALVQVATEIGFWCPAYSGLKKAVQVGTPVWTYRWSQAPSCPWYNVFPASVLPIFGAAHTAEIPFVFANVDNNPPPDGTCNFTAAEKSLSKQIIGFWTSMATNGEPGSQWPEYTNNGTTGINVVKGSAFVNPGSVDYAVCSFWDSVLAVVQNSFTSQNASTGTTTSPPVATYTGGATSRSHSSLYFVTTISVALCLLHDMSVM